MTRPATRRPAAGVAAVAQDSRWREDTAALLIRHWPALAVLGFYWLLLGVLPVMTPVAINDDWNYIRSVEILLSEGRLVVLDIAGATAIPQIVWGAIFAWTGDNTFGAVRVATVAMSGLTSLAVYGLGRELALPRASCALAMAASLLNPLAFVLSYTFMSDPYFTGIATVTAYCYVRGLRVGAVSSPVVVLASGIALLACLQRTQGVFLPIAVVTYLLASRRLKANTAGLRLLLSVTALPATAFLAWTLFGPGPTGSQAVFADRALGAGWSGAWLLTRQLAYVQLMYIGLFVLPIATGAFMWVATARRGPRPWTPGRGGWWVLAGLGAGVIAGLAFFGNSAAQMPYIPQFLERNGLGPSDLWVDRPELLATQTYAYVTVASALSLMLVAALLTGRFTTNRAGRGPAALCLSFVAWHMVTVILPSLAAMGFALSFDRYLLPIVPLAIVLALWAVRLPAAGVVASWAMVGLLGLYAIAGTRDLLVYQGATWEIAETANELGVANTRLSGGFAWDAYHLHELSRELGITQTATPNAPFWISVIAPATDSSYLVANAQLPDHDVIETLVYSSWLQPDPNVLYLQRRPGVDGPP